MDTKKLSLVIGAGGSVMIGIGLYLSTTGIGKNELFTIVRMVSTESLNYSTNWVLIIGLVTTVSSAVYYYLIKDGVKKKEKS